MTNRLLPFLSLIAAVGIFFAYITPLWEGKIADAKAAIAADNKALESAAAYVKRENELAAQVNAMDPAALARLETFLPDSVDNVGIILDLNALAGRTGLVLSSIDVTSSGTGSGQGVDSAGGATSATGQSAPFGGATGERVGTVDLTIAAKGTYDALMSFLAGTELSQRLLDVSDITVTGSDNGVYTYAMTITLYWLR